MFKAFLFVGLLSVTLGKDCERRFEGCKIDYKLRKCMMGEAVACENPFPYSSLEECNRDFSGHGNICEHKTHCHNGGVCLPVGHLDDEGRRVRTFKCDCHGTNYYGKHCEHKCKAKLPKHNKHAEACLF